MAVYVVSFPPSKNFEQYLVSFLQKYPSEDPKVRLEKSLLNFLLLFYSHYNNYFNYSFTQMPVTLQFCQRKLERICQSGAKGKIPTIAEIERAIVSLSFPFYYFFFFFFFFLFFLSLSLSLLLLHLTPTTFPLPPPH